MRGSGIFGIGLVEAEWDVAATYLDCNWCIFGTPFKC